MNKNDTLRPIGNNLLVRLKSREDISKGGIHIPEQAQRAEEWGVVESKGNKVKEPIDVNDVVFIRATQGTHYKSNGQDYILIADTKIICKLSEDKPDNHVHAVGEGDLQDTDK